MGKCMKSILVVLLVSVQLSLYAESFKPIDIIVVWSKELDKEKRELYRRLKVKSVTITWKKFALEIDSPSHMHTTTSIFDENGNEKSFEQENEFDSKYDYKEEYETDSLGNILEAYRDGSLIARQTFDKNGNMLSKKLYEDNESISWAWSYEYDVEGNCVLILKYIAGELLDTLEYCKYDYINICDKTLIKSKISLIDQSKKLYDYDSLCRIINYKEYIMNGAYYIVSKDFVSLTGARIIYETNDKIYATDTSQINTNGDPIITFNYNGDGVFTEKRTYEYKNDLMISKMIHSSKEIKRYENTFDTEGKYLSSKSFIDENEIQSSIFEYYENSLPKSEIHFNYKNNENRSKDYEYEYYD